MFIYSLHVKKAVSHPDGREFLPGHDANQLNKAEVLELVSNFPDAFEPADDITSAMLAETPAHGAQPGGSVSSAGTLVTEKIKKK